MDLQKVSKFLFLVLIVLFVSCDRYKKYDRYTTLENGVWEQDRIISHEVSIEDLSKDYHVFLNLRTDNNFPYRNMFVISKMTSPEGLVVKDTLEYEMADVFGNWLGDGLTDVRNNKLFFLENYKFPVQGVYKFEFEQAMRNRGNVAGVQELLGVVDVGLRIEESKK